MTLKEFLTPFEEDIQFALYFKNIPEATMIFRNKPKSFEDPIFEKEIATFGTFYCKEVEETILGIYIKEEKKMNTLQLKEIAETLVKMTDEFYEIKRNECKIPDWFKEVYTEKYLKN